MRTFLAALALAEKHDNIHATVGVHPNPDPKDVGEIDIDELVELARHPKVVAIGETGLDDYRVKPRQKWQWDRFRAQIRASRKVGKPLVIHTRQAAEDTIQVLQEEGAGLDKGGFGGIMHCFSETMPIAKAALDMGFYISFSGVLTYPASKNLRSLARLIPLDRILIETDLSMADAATVPRQDQRTGIRHRSRQTARHGQGHVSRTYRTTHIRKLFQAFRSGKYNRQGLKKHLETSLHKKPVFHIKPVFRFF